MEERDEAVIIATHPEPALPWWKLKRTKLLLGAVFIIVAAFVIALGAALSSNEPVTNLEVTEIVVVNKKMAF